jgi:spore germination protein
MILHVVKSGETLASIAAVYGVSEARLRYDNQLADPALLVPGQALLVLIPELVYTVKPGDSIYGISQSQGIPLKQLMQNNPWILDQGPLIPGETLVIRYEGEPSVQLDMSAYSYPFTRAATLHEAFLEIQDLLIFSYGFTMEGTLIPPLNETAILEQAREFGLNSILVLTPFGEDGQFNNNLVKVLVEDLEVQDRVIAGLRWNALEKGYRGIDVDFEYILPENRVEYAVFVERLGEAVRPDGLTVSVALAPKTSADQPGLLYEGMDYRLLGEAADSVFLMTYEWGYTYGPPMAVAPLNKVREVVEYALTEIPPDQIFLGVPNYAYDWPLPFERGVTRAETIGNTEAVRIAAENGAEIQWDETAQSPTFTYQRAGVTHEVWFEDVRSWQAKLNLTQEYGLRGVGVWNLLREFRPGWLLVGAMNGTENT